ncbi:MAG: serine hydrolase domain-containing protein, partial [Pirellulaceae bacterium]
MRTFLLLSMTVSLTLAVSDFSRGNDLPRARPRQLNVSARTLGQGVQLFRSAIEKDELRNVELMVLRDGHIILHEALGWQNKEADLPLPRNTLFRMASNTKAVIATGVLLLQQDGKLSVDDPIGK